MKPLLGAGTVLLAATLGQPLTCLAHFPAVYGKDYVRWEESTPASAPAPKPHTRLRSDDETVRNYKQLLQRQEATTGPYAEGLTDPLISLGRYYADNHDYDEALAFYQRALHIVRINDGLHSDRQFALLREVMAIHRASGDKKALDRSYDYFFRLYGSGQPPYTAARFKANLEYLQWQQEAHQRGIDGYPYHTRLLEQYLLNQRLLAAIAELPQLSQDWHRQLVFNQLRNLYLILGEDSLEEPAPGVDLPRATYARDLQSPDFVIQQLDRIQRVGVSRGAKLLRGFLARWPELEPVTVAGIHLELGDWYQWNGSLRNASAEYTEVERILRGAEKPQLLQDWLGAPVELPANDAFKYSHFEPPDAGTPKIFNARYAVSAKGTVRVAAVNPAREEFARAGYRFRRMLKGTHFRPRFADGHGQPVAEVIRDYRLLD